MTIKFECTCGQRVKARDSSAGRWVRCPRCQANLAVPAWDDPGGSLTPAGGAESGSEVSAALPWPETRGGRRDRTGDRRDATGPEGWLTRYGVWAPLGAAGMALAAVLGLVGYAAELPTLTRFGAFMLLVGLGIFLYGRFELRQLPGLRDEEHGGGGR